MISLSLTIYGAYLVLNGLLLFFLPGLALSIVGLEPPDGPWIRVVGLLSSEIGLYFLYASRQKISDFYSLSIYTRLWVAVGFVVLAVSGWGPRQLFLFAGVDALSALWTAWAIRRNR